MPDTSTDSSDPARPSAQPPGSRGVLFPVIVTVLLLATFAAVGVLYARRTYHFQEVIPGVLYRCGNDDVGVLDHAISRAKPKTIVSLIDERELADPVKPQFSEEAKLAGERGIHLVRLPITLGGWPTSSDIQQFLTVAADPQNQPIIVHCAQGVRRTGMMVAAYEMSIDHFTKQQAIDAIQSFGHSEKTTTDVKTFIDAYDPDTRTLTKTLAPSTE